MTNNFFSGIIEEAVEGIKMESVLALVKQEAWNFYSAEQTDNSKMNDAVKKAGETDDTDQSQNQSS